MSNSQERIEVVAHGSVADVGYSQAVSAGPLLFVSGQVAIDSDGQPVALGDVRGQASVVFDRLERLLGECESGMDRVMKITVYLTDPDQVGPVREVRRRAFEPSGHFPASTFVVVSGLASSDYLLEVEAVALRAGSPA